MFVWHFNSVNNGQLASPPIFPLSLFTEGHIGVALFMALSGYVFAKIAEGANFRYLPFLWNRAIRLFPLLLLVFFWIGLLRYVSGAPLIPYLVFLVQGFVWPIWPNGGWSIAVELQFYLLLPLMLVFSRRSPTLLLGVVGLAVGYRFLIWYVVGEVQIIAYWTLTGCIDLFVFGMLAARWRQFARSRHMLAVLAAGLLLGFIFIFDRLGGFYNNVRYPSPSSIWVYYMTFVGMTVAFLIAWYDTSFKFRSTGVSGILAKIGACSYSIYLLHFFFVFAWAKYVDSQLIALSSFPRVLFAAFLTFLAFAPIAYLSYRTIELPLLRFRKQYRISLSEGLVSGQKN